MNPTGYVLPSLLAAVLGDAEFTVAFAQMINWKMKEKEAKTEFSVSHDTLIKKLDTYDPLKEFFNVISYSVEPRWKDNAEDTCPDSESRPLKMVYCRCLAEASCWW